MGEKLAAEFIAAAKGEGASVKKKKMFIKWRKRIKHSHILEFNKLN